MKIMAVEYGVVRTGVAFSDITEKLASPYTVINEKYQPKLIDKLCEIIKTENAEKIVVGLPKNMDGSESFRAEKTHAFAEMLRSEFDLEIIFVDERLSTVQAYTYLNITDFNGKKRKKVIDALSAQIILQSYLDMKK